MDYQLLMAWPARQSGASIVLPLPTGWIGITTSAEVGRAARAHPVLSGSCGPVLVVPGDPVHWVFLAEAGSDPLAVSLAPPGVGLLRPPHEVLLPPSETGFGRVRWANPPLANQRWLPTSTSVLRAIHEVLRRQWRFPDGRSLPSTGSPGAAMTPAEHPVQRPVVNFP
ncbi:hypothetical protein [Lentzea sp.]|uniref:hypothetical protein n=1 Tax=Lentzea sp. TaxID=56099 RepID=UPI002C2905AF|nr:hypothetical protein [Lentzea sp.]HUQ57791.1 hypothetical protein [Lentzea sp.]